LKNEKGKDESTGGEDQWENFSVAFLKLREQGTERNFARQL